MSKKRGKNKRISKAKRGHKSWCVSRHSKSPCNCGTEGRR